jgi:cell wall-associated NlpC family hydrolase
MRPRTLTTAPLILAAIIPAGLLATSRPAPAAAMTIHLKGSLEVARQPITFSATGTVPRRLRALRWAEARKGSAYCWGGTGPCYDCSGLVYEAYRHAGYPGIPRTTYGMLSWWRLKRVYHPRRGDLAFYGTGHVELDTRLWHVTFGAHNSSLPVGYRRWGYGYAPTAFYHIKGAG